MRCIATSATLTKNDVNAASSFASHLFGEEFTHEDVIFGETLRLGEITTTEDPAPALSAYSHITEALREQQLRERLRRLAAAK